MYEITVAVVSEFESRHGGENSLLAVLPHLMRRGVRPIVVAPDSGDFADAVRELGVELVDFRRAAADGTTLSLPEARERLAGILRRVSPKLVHANSLAMGRLAGPVVRRLNLPGVSHLRDIVRLNRQAVADLNENSRLLAVSHATRDFHVAQGISPEKCRVVYNGVDPITFRPRKPTGFLHRELELPDDAVLVGNIGQIGLRKGHGPLLSAMRQVVAALPQTHLIVVGKRWSTKTESVEYERNLYERAAQPPLDGHVHFLGLRRDMPAILNESTLLLHTARQEPLGRALLEAAASGVPVIASQVGGTAEIFAPLEPQNSPAAILISDPKSKNDSDFANEIARQTIALLKNGTLRNNLAQQAIRIARERFSMERSAEAIYANYCAVLSEII